MIADVGQGAFEEINVGLGGQLRLAVLGGHDAADGEPRLRQRDGDAGADQVRTAATASARSPAATSCATPACRRCSAATCTATSAPAAALRRPREPGAATRATGLSVAELSSFGEDACGRHPRRLARRAGVPARGRRAVAVRRGGAARAAPAGRHARLRVSAPRDRAAQRAAAAAADGRAAHRRGVPGDGAARGSRGVARSGARARARRRAGARVVRVRLTRARRARRPARAAPARARCASRCACRPSTRPATSAARPRRECERMTAMRARRGSHAAAGPRARRSGGGRADARHARHLHVADLGGLAARGHARVFVTERVGRVRVIVDGVVQATPFLDLTGITRRHGAGARAAVGRVRARLRDVRALLRLPDRTPAADCGEIQIREYRRSATEPERRGPDQRPPAAHDPAQPGAATTTAGRCRSARTGSCGWRPATAAARTTSSGTRRTRVAARQAAAAGSRRRRRRRCSRRACATRGGSRSRRTAEIVIADVGQNQYEEINVGLARQLRLAVPRGRARLPAQRSGLRRRRDLTTRCSRRPTAATASARSPAATSCAIPACRRCVGRYIYGDYCNSPLRSVVLATGPATPPSA